MEGTIIIEDFLEGGWERVFTLKSGGERDAIYFANVTVLKSRVELHTQKHTMVKTKKIKTHPNTKFLFIFNGQSEQKKNKRTRIQSSSPFSMVSQNKKNKTHPKTKFLSIFNGQSEQKKTKTHPNTKFLPIFNGQNKK